MNEDSKDILIKRLKKRIANNEKRMIKKNLFIAELLLVDQRVDTQSARFQTFVQMKQMQALLEAKQNHKIQELSGENLRLTKENKRLGDTLANMVFAQTNINSIVPERENYVNEIERLRDLVGRLNEDLQQALQDLQSKSEWNGKLQNQLQFNISVVKQKDTELAKLMEQVEAYKNGYLADQHRNALAIIKDLEVKIGLLTHDHDQYTNQENTQLKLQLEMAHKDVERWELVASNINDQLTKAEEYIAYLRDEYADLRNKCEKHYVPEKI